MDFKLLEILANIKSFNDTEKKVRNSKVRYTNKDEFQTKTKNSASDVCICTNWL